MRLLLLTALTMTAFAANSVLNRLALRGDLIGPGLFAVLRLASGALALVLICRLQDRRLILGGLPRMAGAAALLLYMVGFSLAYLQLDAGSGALILFGGVQVTMFAGAVALGDSVPLRRWLGSGLSLAGLVWLLWPTATGNTPFWPALAMAAAAPGWGLYSLAGRRSGDPLAGTASNFVLATPLALVALPLLPQGGPAPSAQGVALALLSGIVTSGMGYALWYAILPALGSARAAVAQLTVPVIALAGSALIIGELPPAGFWSASVVVLAGVALASVPLRRL